jgi:hypothetical protein
MHQQKGISETKHPTVNHQPHLKPLRREKKKINPEKNSEIT